MHSESRNKFSFSSDLRFDNRNAESHGFTSVIDIAAMFALPKSSLVEANTFIDAMCLVPPLLCICRTPLHFYNVFVALCPWLKGASPPSALLASEVNLALAASSPSSLSELAVSLALDFLSISSTPPAPFMPSPASASSHPEQDVLDLLRTVGRHIRLSQIASLAVAAESDAAQALTLLVRQHQAASSKESSVGDSALSPSGARRGSKQEALLSSVVGSVTAGHAGLPAPPPLPLPLPSSNAMRGTVDVLRSAIATVSYPSHASQASDTTPTADSDVGGLVDRREVEATEGRWRRAVTLIAVAVSWALPTSGTVAAAGRCVRMLANGTLGSVLASVGEGGASGGVSSAAPGAAATRQALLNASNALLESLMSVVDNISDAAVRRSVERASTASSADADGASARCRALSPDGSKGAAASATTVTGSSVAQVLFAFRQWLFARSCVGAVAAAYGGSGCSGRGGPPQTDSSGTRGQQQHQQQQPPPQQQQQHAGQLQPPGITRTQPAAQHTRASTGGRGVSATAHPQAGGPGRKGVRLAPLSAPGSTRADASVGSKPPPHPPAACEDDAVLVPSPASLRLPVEVCCAVHDAALAVLEGRADGSVTLAPPSSSTTSSVALATDVDVTVTTGVCPPLRAVCIPPPAEGDGEGAADEDSEGGSDGHTSRRRRSSSGPPARSATPPTAPDTHTRTPLLTGDAPSFTPSPAESAALLGSYVKQLPSMSFALEDVMVVAVALGRGAESLSAAAWNTLATAHEAVGYTTMLWKLYAAVVAAADAGGDRETAEDAVANLGCIYFTAGDFPAAIRWYTDQLERANGRLGGIPKGDTASRRAVQGAVAAAHCNLGLSYHRMRRWTRALQHHKECLRVCNESGDELRAAMAEGNVAATLNGMGKGSQALPMLTAQVDRLTRAGATDSVVAAAWGDVGICELSLGKVDAAQRSFANEIAFARRGGDVPRVVQALAHYAKGVLASGDARAALKAYKDAAAAAERYRKKSGGTVGLHAVYTAYGGVREAAILAQDRAARAKADARLAELDQLFAEGDSSSSEDAPPDADGPQDGADAAASTEGVTAEGSAACAAGPSCAPSDATPPSCAPSDATPSTGPTVAETLLSLPTTAPTATASSAAVAAPGPWQVAPAAASWGAAACS